MGVYRMKQDMIIKKHFRRISATVLIAAAVLLCMAAGSARAQVKTLPGPVQDDRARERKLAKARQAAAQRAQELQLRQKEAAIRRLRVLRLRNRPEVLAPAPPPPVKRIGPSSIFVPTPKGAGDTLDDSQRSSTGLTSDTVTTTQGDLLIGKVIGIEGGKLRFTAPHYEGEVLIFTKSLERVRFAGKGQQSGPAEVVLTNGDYIRGQITAITPEVIVLESKVAAPMSISRKVVSSIAFDGAKKTSLSSDFGSGGMKPWKARAGDWSVRGEQLVISSGGNRNQAVYAELDQSEALTFVAKVKASDRHQLYCYMVVFADSIEGYYGRNSVFARFRSNNCQIGYCQNGGTNNVSSGNIGRGVREGILRFAYDPKTGNATTWVDSTRVDTHTFPPNLRRTKGKYVIFISRYPSQISYLRVLPGIVPPSEGVGSESKAESDTHSIEFNNKDSVSATDVLLTNGTFLAQTPHGELRCPLGKVTNIVFATRGQEKPRRDKYDVLVETADSRLTLQFDKLTDEYLLGSAEHLGQVKLLRSAVRAIEFKILKPDSQQAQASSADFTELDNAKDRGLSLNVLDKAKWRSTRWSGDDYPTAGRSSMDIQADRVRFTVEDKYCFRVWVRYFDESVDYKRYPIVVMRYRAADTIKNKAYNVWMDDGTGPNHGGFVPARMEDLVSDGEVHELRKDLREFNPAGPITGLALGVMSGEKTPATYDLISLHFEAPSEVERAESISKKEAK